jgi:hypothetical protein
MKKFLIAALLIAMAVPAAAQTRDSAGRARPVVFEFEVPRDLSDDAITKGTLPEHAHQAIAEFLELSPAQVEAWDALLDDTRALADPLHTEAEEIQAEIEEQFASGSPNSTIVGELVIERRAIGEELVLIHRNYVEEFEHVILTEDQHRRYHFVRGAARIQPIIPAFRVYRLIPQR